MEATVLSVGKSVLSGALSYAKSALAEEVALQLGVRRDQAFITGELEMMQGFLMCAHEEGREGSSMVVKIWVKQVRDVAYDVEDCLLDFAVRLDHQQSWWCIPQRLLDRRFVAKEMKELRTKVEDIGQRNVRYRLIKESSGQPSSATATISSEVILHVAEATTRAALHREKEKADLAELITRDGHGSVIAVWGASSDVGVTSIIRAAYDKPEVKGKFQCRAWVRLMHPFNPNDLFVSMVRQFYQDSCDESGKAITQGGGTATGLTVLKKMSALDHSLVDEFNRYVTEKRYLVVIADVHTIEEWDWIKTYFPSMNGSQIIVSTQQFEVARLCTEQPYTVAEIEPKWSFDKDLYVFYHKHKVEAQIKGGHKAESSSNGEITSAEEAPREEQQHADQKLTSASAVAAALEEDRLINRVAAKATVIELLSQPGEVITIWGMGGLGKTTLVTSLYQQELSERFQRRAWFTVPHSLNHLSHQEFHEDLQRQLKVDYHGDKEKPEGQQNDNGEETQTTENKKTVETLAEILSNKKCLIVFDDLSSIEDWQWIKQLLPSRENTANKIIVTTRKLNVAESCSQIESQIYNLELLSDEDALRLFEKKVFKDAKERETYGDIAGLTEQANLVLKMCDGLPLAISTIGSFLASKPKTAVEWRNLNRHISAELEMNQELGMIKTVLASSYDGLPYYLKACFLYLSIFPEDHRIRWSRLVRHWIAEGYSRRIRDKTAVETGNSYITELISRSMVRPLQGDMIASGRNGFLDVHDLIRDIAISRATEENLVFTLEEGCDLSTQGKIRHLAISSRWRRDKDVFESALDLSHLRSLTVFGVLEEYFISVKMRLLRVLDLEDTKGLTDQHLHQIGKLVHLIYLSLRGCDGRLRLPDSLGNLRHLQTLDVRDVCIINLPRTIVKLDKLSYLQVGFVPRNDDKGTGRWVDEERIEQAILDSKFKPLRLNKCSCQKILISTCCCCCCFPVIFVLVRLFCFLVNLLVVLWYSLFFLRRFLCVLTRDGCAGLPAYFMGIDPSGVKFPRGTGKLKSLHTVGVVNIDGENAILKELQDLTELRKLRVTGLNKKNCKNFCSTIANLKSLESLFVRSEGKPGLSGCFDDDDLSEPPKNLQSLKLYGNLVKLPAWIMKLRNLVKMELRSSCISEEEVYTTLQVLGGLPNLAILRLLGGSFVGQRLCLSFQGNAFPSLKVLALDLPGGIELVKFEGAAETNKLEEFSWYSSKKEAWMFSGLPSLPSLKEVVLSGATKNFMDGLRAQFAGKTNQPILKLKSQAD
ncbi:disease resistance protein Pik-2 [Triticum aestivum]|uniref:disease resistance protein Pik-2 n=1 Tax=Triticum aestivum TaxID=4565 RepID=UPI001D030B59|nr:disease resistance protein Pik-2-like [Triticum aestivum]